MEEWRMRGGARIHGELRVPGDKSISHRAVLLAALSRGRAVIRGFLESEDCLRTVDALRAFGVAIDSSPPGTLVVQGSGGAFAPPTHDIQCGNSGTSMRLLAGALAAQPFRSRLVGDASLARRPMERVIGPLTAMGATIVAEGKGGRPPLLIDGAKLRGIDCNLPIASAQVKSAVLLAGMFACGVTKVTEPTRTRDHTESLLEHSGVELLRTHLSVSIQGGQVPAARDIEVPGDFSSAAFWLVAAAAQPGSRLIVQNVGLNATRTGALAVLRRMGARIETKITSTAVEDAGTIEVHGASLRGTTIAGAEIPNVIDELPILAVAGALATGRTIIRDAAELRVKESDRLTAIATNLRAMGAAVDETTDGLEITGGRALHGAPLDCYGDHRIAMAFAIAALFAERLTTIRGAELALSANKSSPVGD